MVESNSKMKLAVIGASSGQLPICLKAKEMGLEVHCFAWPDGAVCKEIVDFFILYQFLIKIKLYEYVAV